MPWNITASIRAGSHPGSSIHSRRFIPSHGGLSSASGHGHMTLAGRMSRMTSASPLAGRSRFVDSLGDLEKLPLPGEESELLGMGLETSSVGALGMGIDVGIASSEIGLGGGRLGSVGRETQHDSFELFGPAARVDTQTAGESQWLRGVLDQESMNFLEFIQARIEEEEEVGQGKGKAIAGVISFGSLLPPEENTRVVATQALMHVLSLATRGALKVRQEESRCDDEVGCRMGEIYMALAA
ncbi:hypothetical protein KEM55_003803 [Ascosphaera atra]|nr:hypothetical protein KEM55_003803 [Ascosphaera atra]